MYALEKCLCFLPRKKHFQGRVVIRQSTIIQLKQLILDQLILYTNTDEWSVALSLTNVLCMFIW